MFDLPVKITVIREMTWPITPSSSVPPESLFHSRRERTHGRTLFVGAQSGVSRLYSARDRCCMPGPWSFL
jgi:hypothetical protein